MMPRFLASCTKAAVAVLMVALVFAGTTIADDGGAGVPSGAVGAVLGSVEGVMSLEPPMVYQADDGYLVFFAAPQGARLVAPQTSGKSSGSAEDVAKNYLYHHGDAFGVHHAGMNMRTSKVVRQHGQEYVRLDQYYSGHRVLGAQVIVQLDEAANVKTINANVMRHPGDIEGRDKGLLPVLTSESAVDRARVENAALENVDAGEYRSEKEPELILFEPAVFSMPGDTRLAWLVNLISSKPFVRGMNVVIDADTGDILVRFPDRAGMLSREVYDAGYPDYYSHAFDPQYEVDWTEALLSAERVRREGEPVTGVSEFDNLYDYLGDCYAWNMNMHGRDSFDDEGAVIRAVAHFPFLNAAYMPSADLFLFGEGFVTDDIVGHEFEHAVTEYVTDMIYFSFSGAIIEMYSDQAGEFIDLTNNRGNDSDAVRWIIGEDMKYSISDMRGMEGSTPTELDNTLPGIRYMKDPTAFGHPDHMGSPLLSDPFSLDDLGGVHSNNGIGNKLVYLLTDGDTFNGQTVYGMGIPKVADLMYAARPLLTGLTDYYQFYYALRGAAVSLGFTVSERLNVMAAARAVGIEPSMMYGSDLVLTGMDDFRVVAAHTYDGAPVIALTWWNPAIPYQDIQLYKSVDGYVTEPVDGVLLSVNNDETSYLDTNVVDGITYYYTLLIYDNSTGLPFPLYSLYAKATAGEGATEVLAEFFGEDLSATMKPFDLSYSQVYFIPVPDPPLAFDPAGYDMRYNDYIVTVQKNVYALPHSRSQMNQGSFNLEVQEDVWSPLLPGAGDVTEATGYVAMRQRRFPFFGRKYALQDMYVSPRGSLAFIDQLSLFSASEFEWLDNSEYLAFLHTASMSSFFALPRIAFFMTNQLSPQSGGRVWWGALDDRIVVTLEDADVNPTSSMSRPDRVTVQMEIFDSGHIRITWLNGSMPAGIVGLSDGRGVPVEPALLYPDTRAAYYYPEFSAFSQTPTRLSIDPIGPRFLTAGELAMFLAVPNVPIGLAGSPVLYADWTGLGAAPFSMDMDLEIGRFQWQTSESDAGPFVVRVYAEMGREITFQDVNVMVGDVVIAPTAGNLQISTGSSDEDSTLNRPVSVGLPLVASYEYTHPLKTDPSGLYREGNSELYWFINGRVAAGYRNVVTIPPYAPQPNDEWWFMVTPITVSGVRGEPVRSPVVRVLAVPSIHSINPGMGLITGNERVVIRGENLLYPSAVTFGEVPGSAIEVISAQEISVLTPPRTAGKVAVAVETPGGIGRRLDAFTFEGGVDIKDDDDSQKERRFLGCGATDSGRAGAHEWYFLLVLFVFFTLGLKSGRARTGN